VVVLLCASPAFGDSPPDARLTALQALNDFIGSWKGTGGPDKPRPAPSDPVWAEQIDWSWRFKAGDVWLSFAVTNGKFLSGGEVRFHPAKKVYLLTARDAKKNRLEFEGKLDGKGYLVFERLEAGTGETQQITMNSAAEGVRFIYRYATKAKGSTLFSRHYLVAATREGESLGKADKKNVCVVTGGLGTMAVNYQGETFYVCCSGCRDAFNEDPAKFVREFKAKKK
jgi:hypothetical protein